MYQKLVFSALTLAGISLLSVIFTAVIEVFAAKFFLVMLGVLLVVFGILGFFNKETI